jgi:signal transduction histidine kinase
VVKEIDPALPRVHARRQDIEQLFLNLISNARESMENGGCLTVRAWIEPDDDGEMLGLSIADTGHGIPADLLHRVFEPFFTTKQGGTGLGLDICRSICWEYDGNLWLESNRGKGTVAQVRLSMHARQPDGGVRTHEPAL